MSAPRNVSEVSGTSIGKDKIVPSKAESMTGAIIADRYRVLSTLGTGAMGTVYKARHELLNREVAIKMLKSEATEDESSHKRFENEARAAASLSHTHLITVTDYGFLSNGSPFLVMDYVEGRSLAGLVKQPKAIDDALLLTVMTQICSGLAHAHEKGLIHRDLKPSNILITTGDGGRPHVKIVDFGLAKPIVGDQDLTHTGQVFGTPLYMSPEQCQGRKLDARSDIYSLGCLMYRIVSGRLPFSGENPVTTIVMHVKDAPPAIPLEKLTSEFRYRLVPVIMRCLEKDPDLRPQSVMELRSEILAAWAGQKTKEPATPVDSIPIPKNRKKKIPFGLNALAVVACGLVAVASVAMLVVPKTEKPPQQTAAPVKVQQQIVQKVEPKAAAPKLQAITPPKVTKKRTRTLTYARVSPDSNGKSTVARKKPGIIRKLINKLFH